MGCLLVVVYQVYVHRLAVLKAEYDSPVAGYPAAPLPAPVSSQRVYSPTRNLDVARRFGVSQDGKYKRDASRVSGV